MMQRLGRSFSALIENMHEGGLIAETLVCFVTEVAAHPA